VKILFTGKGSAGSWQMRGAQLGMACGAEVSAKASEGSIESADVVVLVKRPGAGMVERIRKSGVKWAWDLVDFYPQPTCSKWPRDYAIKWVRSQIKSAKPNAVIWPNARMQDDCSDGRPSLVLYHHSDPRCVPKTINKQISRVSYCGSHRYIKRWGKVINSECQKRGWKFRIDASPIPDGDIVVAFRDKEHCGYVQRHWKSNVKLANAHACGIPFVGSVENGYLETCSGREMLTDKPEDLPMMFDALESQDNRQSVSDAFVRCTYRVEDAARELKDFLISL
jgi:hypothetical protein